MTDPNKALLVQAAAYDEQAGPRTPSARIAQLEEQVADHEERIEALENA